LAILETNRLILRRWTPADELPLYAICSDPVVMQYVGDGAPWSRERTRQFIEEALATEKQYGYCRWPLLLKDDQMLAGFCGFTPAEHGAEIGWRLAKGKWGQGLATEAARAVLEFGLEKLGFQRVTATVQSGNEASRRVAEKLGMAVEKRVERHAREVLILVANAAPGEVAL
jgi:ribosomal-protein-alanine N-acetyltransferase